MIVTLMAPVVFNAVLQRVFNLMVKSEALLAKRLLATSQITRKCDCIEHHIPDS